MVTRAPFLKTRYGGYFHREVPAEDAELTHVGAGTPCGEYFRRFWQPICFSDELRDLPRRVKILGEDLVVFRDQSGAVGLLELHCPHRGTSLEFGLIDAKGYGAAITDGCSRRTGRSSRHLASRRRAPSRIDSITGLIPPTSTTASSLRIWARPTGSHRSRCTTASAGQAIV